jgi:hypothetical protein
MHRSRLGGFIIDCKTDDLNSAAEFWADALGTPINTEAYDSTGPYVELQRLSGEVHVEVQRVDHKSRVHLDIETDDIEAEVKRLETLGARRIGTVKRWCVMEAPTGQRFCVVNVVSTDFNERANEWN